MPVGCNTVKWSINGLLVMHYHKICHFRLSTLNTVFIKYAVNYQEILIKVTMKSFS